MKLCACVMVYNGGADWAETEIRFPMSILNAWLLIWLPCDSHLILFWSYHYLQSISFRILHELQGGLFKNDPPLPISCKNSLGLFLHSPSCRGGLFCPLVRATGGFNSPDCCKRFGLCILILRSKFWRSKAHFWKKWAFDHHMTSVSKCIGQTF